MPAENSGTDLIAKQADKVFEVLRKKGIAITPAVKAAVYAKVADVLGQSKFNRIGPDSPVHISRGINTDTLFHDPVVENVIMRVLYYGQRDSLGNRPLLFEKTFSR